MKKRNGTSSGLGEIIAQFRQRLRQPGTGLAWSQEDLALASGTDQAHISRIETNQKHPQYSTLTRICDALELSRSERSYVYALFGYTEKSMLPSQREAEIVLKKLTPLLESYPYPATLLDKGERVWHFNRRAVALWGDGFGAQSQEDFLERARGKAVLELIFMPEGQIDPLLAFHSAYEDFDNWLNRLIVMFWRAYRTLAGDPQITAIVNKLTNRIEFLQRWQRIEKGDINILFFEHGQYTFRHSMGTFRYNSWRTHTAVDDRFVVTHCTPIDSRTIRGFENLNCGHLRGRDRSYSTSSRHARRG